MSKMDFLVKHIVCDYVYDHLDKTDKKPNFFDIYIVWKCKTLKNWKYLISTDLYDGMYYEVTYNGELKEWYLDAYKKIENKVVHPENIGFEIITEDIR